MLIKIEEKSQRCHIKKNGGSINFLSILELTWSDRSDRFAWPVRPVEPADRLLGPTTNKTSLSFYQQLRLAFHRFLSRFLPSSRALSPTQTLGSKSLPQKSFSRPSELLIYGATKIASFSWRKGSSKVFKLALGHSIVLGGFSWFPSINPLPMSFVTRE